MFDVSEILNSGVSSFFAKILKSFTDFFAKELADVMSLSQRVLEMDLVKNGIDYAQVLAFTLLVLKTMSEAFQTYILYQNGDPESDPGGLLIRTAQAVAVIATLPDIVGYIFEFGTMVALDVSNLSGEIGVKDWDAITSAINGGLIVILLCLFLAICFLIVGIQAVIRGAELALMAVVGPLMALNLTANNRSVWSAWLKQVIIICMTQAIQIFLIKATVTSFTGASPEALLLTFGWMWITIKSPKYIQQFVHSTGFSGAVGGTAKQVGSMALMRRMLAR